MCICNSNKQTQNRTLNPENPSRLFVFSDLGSFSYVICESLGKTKYSGSNESFSSSESVGCFSFKCKSSTGSNITNWWKFLQEPRKTSFFFLHVFKGEAGKGVLWFRWAECQFKGFFCTISSSQLRWLLLRHRFSASLQHPSKAWVRSLNNFVFKWWCPSAQCCTNTSFGKCGASVPAQCPPCCWAVLANRTCWNFLLKCWFPD